ncbi:Prophage PSPPH06, site-specific recombinase phage integrase protein [Pseudomonas savastanoi pv. glycinea]|nr:Prophage PSPPH06, site-specific recombinase phage integrase protein [Pseudomonas savastanoi pv. glycinea]
MEPQSPSNQFTTGGPDRFLAPPTRNRSAFFNEERFGLHDLKRRGITDTVGNRAVKQEASGHRDEAMMDVYDLSLPLVNASQT